MKNVKSVGTPDTAAAASANRPLFRSARPLPTAARWFDAPASDSSNFVTARSKSCSVDSGTPGSPGALFAASLIGTAPQKPAPSATIAKPSCAIRRQYRESAVPCGEISAMMPATSPAARRAYCRREYAPSDVLPCDIGNCSRWSVALRVVNVSETWYSSEKFVELDRYESPPEPL